MSNTKETCQELRSQILKIGEEVQKLRKTPHAILSEGANAKCDAGEIIANVTLAYRHLEDARMRLGKAVQAFDGGTSVYEK